MVLKVSYLDTLPDVLHQTVDRLEDLCVNVI